MHWLLLVCDHNFVVVVAAVVVVEIMCGSVREINLSPATQIPFKD